MKKLKRLFAIICCLGLISGVTVSALDFLTPYSSLSDTNVYFNGATYILPDTSKDAAAIINSDFASMTEDYKINTISIYNLEGFDKSGDNTNKDILFKMLKKYNMKAVVRIENYRASDFTFSFSDIDYVMDSYKELIEYVSNPQNREQVAYFALNMPVDDGTVQKNLGGINSEKYIKNQVSYAEELVKRMRNATKAAGFNNAQMYLSVFYGWDNSYDTPSYKSANADGYFINNYSYPVNPKSPANEKADDETLINSAALKKGMDKFYSQYGDSKLVIEYGFHTAEHNDGVISNQTAGLVATRAAKEKALKAISRFYSNYTFVNGMMYFGFNLYKNEGSPAMEMDWALQESVLNAVEAESATLNGGAKVVKDGNLTAVSLSNKSDEIYLPCVASFAQLGIRYKAEKDTSAKLYINDDLKAEIAFAATEKYDTAFINLAAMADSNLKLVLSGKNELFVDSFSAFSKIEAENTVMERAGKVKDKSASQQYCASMVANTNITFSHIRGGSSLKICYEAANGAVLQADINGTVTEITLPAADDYTELSFKINIPADSSLKLSNTGKEDIRIDYISVNGIGTAVSEVKAENGSEYKTFLIIALAAAVISILLFTVVLIIYKKAENKR